MSLNNCKFFSAIIPPIVAFVYDNFCFIVSLTFGMTLRERDS